MGVLLFALNSRAQTKTVTGTISSETGGPVPFATVNEKGTSHATSADENGKFEIKVKNGAVLVFSAAGFEDREVASGSEPLSVILKAGRGQNIDEVVVTAMGVRRSRNTLTYSVQQIGGEEVSNTRTANAASALSGKVSGLQIQQGNGIGGSTNVVIRGYKSILGNNQALFVVDGVPIDNSNTNTANQVTGRGGYDYGNAAADINPDDIESISVLKGAAATALYGSRASNGVVMITTKKAKRGLAITINSGVIVGKIDKSTFAKYQKEYGAGYSSNYQKDGFLYFDVDGDGQKDLVVPTSEDASFGTKFDPNLMVYHWDAFDSTSQYYLKKRPWVAAEHDPSDFYETGVTTNNSISLAGASDKGDFKTIYTRNDERGVLPNSRVVRNTINFGASYNITDKLTIKGEANFSKLDGRGRYGSGYSGLNVNQNFRQWYQTNVDILEQKEAYFRTGRNISWNWADPSKPSGLISKYTNNYYWTVYKNYETDTRSRTFGNIALLYKPVEWLDINGRVTLDTYNELQEERIAVGSQGVASYIRRNRSFQEINYDLFANMNKQLNTDFLLNGTIGTNIRRTTVSSVTLATNGGLVVPDLYSIANSRGTPANPVELYQPIGVDGYFARVALSYQEMLSLEGTFRRDISSTLPKNKNGYNYYAISGGFVFSKLMESQPWLSYGKLRLNYATVGSSAAFGSLFDVYTQPNPFGASTLYSVPDIKNNKDLKPEITESKEIGVEMAFLKNRLGFDVTFYITNTRDQLMPLDLSTATGYSSIYVNAATVQNKGIELSLNGTPVRAGDFSWNVNLNWTRNRNKVTKLYGDIKNLVMGTFQSGISVNASLGQPMGTIQGKTWTMVDPNDPSKTVPWDGVGQKLVDRNGYYILTSTTTNIFGNVNPDWYGGIYNSVRYKNLSLGFLVDMRKGGTVWSLDMFYGTMYTGIYPETAGLNDLGNPVRNRLADGGGIILPGVTADGKPNTTRVVVDANKQLWPAANFAYDASYVKLREVNLTYSFPAKWFNRANFIKGADFSLIGRNLWLIHKNVPYADPEENLSSGNIQGIQSGAYPTTRSLGANLKINF